MRVERPSPGGPRRVGYLMRRHPPRELSQHLLEQGAPDREERRGARPLEGVLPRSRTGKRGAREVRISRPRSQQLSERRALSGTSRPGREEQLSTRSCKGVRQRAAAGYGTQEKRSEEAAVEGVGYGHAVRAHTVRDVAAHDGRHARVELAEERGCGARDGRRAAPGIQRCDALRVARQHKSARGQGQSARRLEAGAADGGEALGLL